MSAEAKAEAIMASEDLRPVRRAVQYGNLHKQVERRDNGASTGLDAEYMACHYLMERGDFKWALVWDDLDQPGPHRWQKVEYGVDVIAEHIDGSVWAIQVKDYQKFVGYAAFTNMSTFVRSGERKGAQIDRMAIFCADAPASRPLREICKEENTVIFDRTDLIKHEWPSDLDELMALYKTRRKRVSKALVRKRLAPPVYNPARKLWKHQKAAIKAAKQHFAEGGTHGRIYMVTGGGKTVTFVKLAEDYETVLVVVPRLLLAKQTYEKFVRESKEKYDHILFVASKNPTDYDKDDLDPSQLPALVTTRPSEIAAFMERPGRKLIISTYHSCVRIAKAEAKIDLALYDEAHHAAEYTKRGDKPKRAQQLLPYKGIERSLFFTATPRTYSSEIKGKQGHYVASMDDSKKFGPLLYEFCYSDALGSSDKIVKPYEIHIIGLTEDQYRDALKKKNIKDKATLDNLNTNHICGVLAIEKVTEQYPLTHGLGFANSIDNAINVRTLYEKHVGTYDASTLSSRRSIDDNSRDLTKFEEAQGGFITNVNILSEGMDAPCIDYVLFADPMQSRQSIAQKIGRGLRYDPSNPDAKLIVIVPVLLDENNLVDEGAFKTIMEVLGGMITMDKTLGTEVQEIASNEGPGHGREPRIKIDADIPKVDIERLTKVLTTAVYSTARMDWWMRFAELQAHLGVDTDTVI